MSSLHADIHNLVHFKPIEDMVLGILREALTGVLVGTLIEDDHVFPAVMVRSNGDWGLWNGDTRFIDTAQLNVQVFTEGLNADEDGQLLSEAVRVVLIGARNQVIPGIGHITHIEMIERPRRLPDWATSAGPVQYADLPTGVFRYETIYEVAIKKRP